MKKKGVSGIISVALMVLLVIVAVSLIWILVSRSVEEGKTDIEKGVKLSGVRLKIVGESVWVNGTNVSFLVEREAGSEEISGFIVVLGDGNITVSIEKYSNSSIAELGRFFVHIEPSEHTLSSIYVIEVYGIVEVDEEIGVSSNPQDVYQVTSAGGGGGGNQPTNSCSNDAGCGTDSFVAETEQCVGNDVYAEFLNYTCNLGSCESQSNLQLKETCEDSCLAGECVDYLRVFYASPNGNGNGLTIDAPFEISDFWSISGGVQPGDALILLDGTYTGANGMINPPFGLSGAAGNPITVRALNDGKVWIDGEGDRAPVVLDRNNYFVLEGFNAYSSNYHVVAIAGNLSYSSHDNIIRRVVAWDGSDGNNAVIQIAHSFNNLVEDSAFFGVGRYTVSTSQGGNYTTLRRIWSRWEGSHEVGAKTAYSLAYSTYDVTAENILGTWDGVMMDETYVLMSQGYPCYDPQGGATHNPECFNITTATYTNYTVNLAADLIGGSGLAGENRNSNSKLLGSIAYTKPGQRVPNSSQINAGIAVAYLNNFEIKDTISIMVNNIRPVNIATMNYWTSNTNYSVNHAVISNPINGHYYMVTNGGLSSILQPIWLLDGSFIPDGGVTWIDKGAFNLVARDISTIGAASNIFGWSVTGRLNGANVSSAYGSQTAFTATTGANICYKYIDGVKTNEGLWPWPMEQRIMEATAFAGRPVENVTQTMIDLFGPIPDNCRWNL